MFESSMKKKYHQELFFKSCKRVTNMSDLTEKEIELWIRFLKHVGDDEIFEYTNDIFDDSENYYQGYNDKI
jgi:hypothetical protein